MQVTDLRDELKARGLKTDGNKVWLGFCLHALRKLHRETPSPSLSRRCSRDACASWLCANGMQEQLATRLEMAVCLQTVGVGNSRHESDEGAQQQSSPA